MKYGFNFSQFFKFLYKLSGSMLNCSLWHANILSILYIVEHFRFQNMYICKYSSTFRFGCLTELVWKNTQLHYEIIEYTTKFSAYKEMARGMTTRVFERSV